MEKIEYYIITRNLSLDSNQWSILIGFAGVFLTILGFIIAYCIYLKQRSDNANDAYNFLESSLPELKNAISITIINLNEFVINLKKDEFINPILPASLNDNLISKINLVDLKRYFKKEKAEDINTFEKLLVDSNFFGSYQNYFINELNYFREKYFLKESIYSDWNLLRSNSFFSTIIDVNENEEYKKFYKNWVLELNKDETVFDSKNHKLKSRKLLIEKHITPLIIEVFPFIEFSEKANNINLLSNRIVAAFNDMESIKNNVIKVLVNDIEKFKDIERNIDCLLKK